MFETVLLSQLVVETAWRSEIWDAGCDADSRTSDTYDFLVGLLFQAFDELGPGESVLAVIQSFKVSQDWSDSSSFDEIGFAYVNFVLDDSESPTEFAKLESADVRVAVVAPERSVRERKSDLMLCALVVFGHVPLYVAGTTDGRAFQTQPVFFSVLTVCAFHRGEDIILGLAVISLE